MDWINALSLGIACLSALGTLYVWIAHGRKINKFQLEKFEKEKKEEKKAHIAGNIISKSKGTKSLKVFNSGKAPAFNVGIDFCDNMWKEVPVMNKNILPYTKLDSQNGFEINFISFEGMTGKTVEIRFIWDDERGENNENNQTLQM
jgi:hypothetical protein